ncbi:MAG TPA: O-acetyl-ADP-ribose deacetylase [Flavobacteriaceae bacterium]|nr:O-acetyl-ADP-ribose deacetylase [Flavobacteriaceae bacterium]
MKIELIKGDITKIETDVIVNAANSSLMGGGGVDGAIHRSGGSAILEECKKIIDEQGELPTGEAVITGAGKLPSDYVIHTVGPVWKDGSKNEAELLNNCYKNSLKLAEENNAKSIAFPNISTGVYGFPKKKAAEIAVKTVKDYKGSIEKCVFVCFDDENYSLYESLLKE